jgi:hypothetical protein
MKSRFAFSTALASCAISSFSLNYHCFMISS